MTTPLDNRPRADGEPAGPPAAPASMATGAERPRHLARSFLRDAAGRVRHDVAPRELHAAIAVPGDTLWVDVDSRDATQHALLEKVFSFHPLAIEDTLNPSTRVKVDEYEGSLFVTVRVVRFCEETPENPYDLDTSNLYFFIGANFLVTVHSETMSAVETVAALVARNPDLLQRGPARLAHMIMDLAVDAYFPIIDRVDELVDGLEDRVFQAFDQSAIHDIFSTKRMVLSLRRYLLPQREIFNVLANRPTPFLPAQVQVYFRDVYDHMLRINDSLENYRELLSGTLDSYLSQVSNRLGAATKGLSVVATIGLPFMIVSGMWGMNFERIPLGRYAHGFWLMLAAQCAMSLVLVVVLRLLKMI